MSMRIRNTVEEHPIAAVVSSAVALFGVALGVVAWLYQERIANVTAKYEAEVAVLRARLDRAEGANKPEVNDPTSANSSTVKTPGLKASPPATTTSTSTEVILANKPLPVNQPPLSAANTDVFTSNNPYPIDHSRAKVGVRLSSLKLIYPEGEVKSWGYVVKLQHGPFSKVTYWMGDEVFDPPSNSITFEHRNESTEKAVWASAASAFQGLRHTAVSGGVELIWQFKGLKATLNETGYHLNRDGY